ncbi:Cyclic nucleotide-gated ion channel 1 [Sesamum angolense]|uniref:Cyclic nucleotide-gated ion channel 1 n=1 Tax=Sesamum angolense TaxID=2727404 RepID=A0AAE1WB59_9LAMI|nr:Cyclic nucleotide-gated ion channel 1 [Sesamum angolense]
MNQSGNRCASRQFPWRRKPSFSQTVGGIKSYERTEGLRKGSLDGEHTRSNRPKSSPKKKVVDPQEPFLLVWNKMFVISCMISIFLDPLFFYAPVVDAKNPCLSLDQKLEIAACVLRSFFDIVYVVVISIANAPTSPATKDFLKMVIFAQYIPRFYRIYPLTKEIMRTSGAVITETALPAAAYNLHHCILASHVLGAMWYLMAIERKERCWQMTCGDHNGCKLDDLYCGVGRGDTSFLNSSCPLLEPNEIKSPADFDFGIFLDAHKSHVEKFFASSSPSLGVLVASVISSSIQQFVQSITGRLEEVRMKRRDIEQWMSHRMLPEDLRALVGCNVFLSKAHSLHGQKLYLSRGRSVDEMLFIMKVIRLHSKQLQHTYRQVQRSSFHRFYSQQWRTWGANFIQATWRRHYKRKVEKLLQEAEDTLQNPLSKEGSGSLPSLAATVYASRFATNMLGNLRRNHPHLQKPAEPDFSAENPS